MLSACERVRAWAPWHGNVAPSHGDGEPESFCHLWPNQIQELKPPKRYNIYNSNLPSFTVLAVLVGLAHGKSYRPVDRHGSPTQAPALQLLHDMSRWHLPVPDLCRTSVMSAAVKSHHWDFWHMNNQQNSDFNQQTGTFCNQD